MLSAIFKVQSKLCHRKFRGSQQIIHDPTVELQLISVFALNKVDKNKLLQVGPLTVNINTSSQWSETAPQSSIHHPLSKHPQNSQQRSIADFRPAHRKGNLLENTFCPLWQGSHPFPWCENPCCSRSSHWGTQWAFSTAQLVQYILCCCYCRSCTR